MYFFCFSNIFLAAKLSKWRLFWLQNENGCGRLDFCATTFFFSKINVTFLDVWMILIELFDISVSFRFQNFPRTNFSRYGGLYGLSPQKMHFNVLNRINIYDISLVQNECYDFLFQNIYEFVRIFLSFKCHFFIATPYQLLYKKFLTFKFVLNKRIWSAYYLLQKGFSI